MKILNLYAGLGGNRAGWSGHEVTSVELSPEIATVYAKCYPQDTVIVGDAMQYLEEHYAEFDFIWASPPCPSHGQYRHNVGVVGKGYKPIMPDMSLYAQIVFLQHYAKGRWVIENVKPYYEPLIKPTVELQRHLFWSNFYIPHLEFGKADIRHKNKLSDFDNHQIISGSKISNKRQALRNCVDPELGAYILACAQYIRGFNEDLFGGENQ